jgi:hypothetical protein
MEAVTVPSAFTVTCSSTSRIVRLLLAPAEISLISIRVVNSEAHV